MGNTTPLAFNTAMKVWTSHTLYERNEAKLMALAREGDTLHRAGLDAARVLEKAAHENASKPETQEHDVVAGWLVGATTYAMHGHLQGAARCVGALPSSLSLQSPTYGMVACLCSPGHAQAIVQADARLAQFGRLWTLAFEGLTASEREESMAMAVHAMVKAGMQGTRQDGAYVLGARTAAWQVHRLLVKP